MTCAIIVGKDLGLLMRKSEDKSPLMSGKRFHTRLKDIPFLATDLLNSLLDILKSGFRRATSTNTIKDLRSEKLQVIRNIP